MTPMPTAQSELRLIWLKTKDDFDAETKQRFRFCSPPRLSEQGDQMGL
jgi:hypothetical protein